MQQAAKEVVGPTLSSQNQLYAVLMLSCARWRVRRPHRYLLALVDDIDSRPENIIRRTHLRSASPSTTTTAQDPITSSVEMAAPDPRQPVIADVPLASLSEIKMGSEHYGNATLCVLLDIMAHLPLITSVDWSEQPLFAADAYRMTVSGNEVLRRLFDWASHQRRLTKIILKGIPLGTRVVHYMIDALKANAGIVTIDFDESWIEKRLLAQLHRALDDNRSGRNQRRPPDYHLSDELRVLDTVDRSDSAARRELHQLLWEFPSSFGLSAAWGDDDDGEDARGSVDGDSTGASKEAVRHPSSEDDDEIIRVITTSAVRRSLTESVNASLGLRGDGGSLYVVASGSISVNFGAAGSSVRFTRGDYFGELLDAELYPAAQLTVEERGFAFQVPHAAVAAVMHRWERRVIEYLPILNTCVLLQSLPKWVRIRSCHDARYLRFSKGDIAIAKGKGFSGIYIVTRGAFLVRGRAKLGRAAVTFTRGDLFGEEAAVSRLNVSTVDIKCLDDDAEVLHLSARHSRHHLIPLLKSIFALQVKSYSDAV